MNVAQFFRHWSITENPFRGEEARNDAVFQRLSFAVGEQPSVGDPRADDTTLGSVHSDFDKILGELTRPSTSVVFGEKGSGKTAIRMQIAGHVARHNRKSPDDKIFLVPYDDPNPFVAELVDRFASAKDPAAPFAKARLVDHIDAVLSIATDRIVAALFREGPDRDAADLGDEPAKTARKLPVPLRRDLLLLQALYDPADITGDRTARLRRLLRLGQSRSESAWNVLTAIGWLPAAAVLFFAFTSSSNALAIIGGVLLLAYAAVLAKRFVADRLAAKSLAGKIRKEMRFLARPTGAVAASLSNLEPALRRPHALPTPSGSPHGHDEPRYHHLRALRSILHRFGYTGMLVVIDRVDEPTAIAGDAEKMRGFIWPLLNNKFLNQDGFGVKMLLPVELRYPLMRESATFFQEARLDKQGFIERLTWTGPMLYDLCNARLHACRDPEAQRTQPINLIDLFAEDVARAELVEALDQMGQPRDAFKLLYRTLNEHAAAVTADEGAFRITKAALTTARRAETDRVKGFAKGLTPA